MYSKGACNVRRYGATEAWVQIRCRDADAEINGTRRSQRQMTMAQLRTGRAKIQVYYRYM